MILIIVVLYPVFTYKFLKPKLSQLAVDPHFNRCHKNGLCFTDHAKFWFIIVIQYRLFVYMLIMTLGSGAPYLQIILVNCISVMMGILISHYRPFNTES